MRRHDLTTKHIPIADLLFDTDTQIREKTKVTVVRAYKQAMREYAPDGDVVVGFPPIKVAETQAKGARKVYTIIDGWHRATAAYHLGKRLIEAELVQVNSREDLLWQASQANLLHGEKLTVKEKRGAFRNYLKALQHRQPGPKGGRANGKIKSARQMALDLGGIDHKTILRWLKADAPRTYAQLMKSRGEEDDMGFVDDASDYQWDPDAHHRQEVIALLQQAKNSARMVIGQPALSAIANELSSLQREISRRLPKESTTDF
jgi:hypothetical protein